MHAVYRTCRVDPSGSIGARPQVPAIVHYSGAAFVEGEDHLEQDVHAVGHVVG